MTKHMRLVVSVLFIVIIVLAVAITRFYSSTGKSTELSGTQPAIEKILDDDKSGNHIFQNDSGMYGIIDSNERVIVYPEWNELKFTESGLCIASKRIRGKMLFGGIDYEGNISLPFVYSDISRINMPYPLFTLQSLLMTSPSLSTIRTSTHVFQGCGIHTRKVRMNLFSDQRTALTAIQYHQVI